MTVSPTRKRRRTALWLFVGLLVAYNANGREIGTVDSQPAKFTAREVAVLGTTVLDRVVAERPGLAERPAFAVDRDGHTRSAYPIAPGLIAAMPATLLHGAGLVDLDAPVAPNLVAKLTASVLTSAAVVLVFLAVARLVTHRAALATAIGLGVGTNYWAQVSQTLWGHETVAFGLALALFAWLRSTPLRSRDLWLGAVGLVLAGAARPQVAVLIVGLLLWLWARTSWYRASGPAVLVAAAGLATMAINYAWFEHVLGAIPRLEAIHPEFHGVDGSLGNPVIGGLGLLVSPSRGLLIFSPVVLVIAAGIGAVWRGEEPDRLRWLVVAAGVQFLAYAAYAVWWGGHTFGPRYAIDLLVPLSPVAALGVSRGLASGRATVMAALLAWSVGVAALGTFVYPHERWNTSPAGVDLNHVRLWDPLDTQILRALVSGPNPRNFNLVSAEAVRQSPE